MQPRPVIGIATETREAIPGQSPLSWTMGQRYVRALTAAGAVPWLIPLLDDSEGSLRCIYERLQGVFLTGGADVDPRCYGEDRHPACGENDPDRDRTELLLVRRALADHKPILGVCRGIQVLNVTAGGTLYQDIPSQLVRAIKHDHFPSRDAIPANEYLMNPVRVSVGSRLGRILDAENPVVNSLHHQAIKELAPGLVFTAHAPDGLIEGVEGPNGHFVIGVQWHPEEMVESDLAKRRLFLAFVEAAAGFKRPFFD